MAWGPAAGAAIFGAIATAGAIALAHDERVLDRREVGFSHKPVGELRELRPAAALPVTTQGRTLRAPAWPEAECELDLAAVPAASTALAGHVREPFAAGRTDEARPLWAVRRWLSRYSARKPRRVPAGAEAAWSP